MIANPDDFEKELLTLVRHVVKKATQDATPFTESVDAFKQLTAYYALRLKHRTGEDDDTDSGFSFDQAGLDTTEKPNGGQSVRSRSRRPS